MIGAISLAAGALLIWDMSKIWQTPAVGWTGLLLYPTFTLLAATVGSETPLYIALCLAAFALYARRRYSFSAAAAGLAALTRPDGILVAAVLAGDFLLRNRPIFPWRAIAIYAAFTLPWLVFAWIYFGNPFPVTLAAKQFQGNLEVSQYFAPGMLWILNWYHNGWQYWLELLLVILGFFWLVRSARQWGLVLTWTGLYFIAYSLLRVSRYFWYYSPLVPGFIILIGLGVQATISFLREKSFSKSSNPNQTASSVAAFLFNTRWTSYIPNFVAAALLIPLAAAQLVDLWKLGQKPDPKGPIYKTSGEWLRANTPTGTLVGSLEAGIIGYYSERPMVDFAGLIEPEVARQMLPGATYDGVADWTMQEYAPRYTVMVAGDLQNLKEGYLEKNCHVVQHFLDINYDSLAVNIYACP
jgi:hypothetical protein